MEYAIYVIVYLTGVIFDLAVIAYLNERKGEMYFHGFALASWALWLVFLLIGIDAVLMGYVTFSASCSGKDMENVRQNFKTEQLWRICQN